MRTTFALPILLASSFLALPALAQTNLNESNIRSGAPKAPRPSYQTSPPPVAVPGAQPRADSVAPMERSAADLPPTEALFDSINRGDIVTARDAISRGADLDGTNLLGVTPLELSVDSAETTSRSCCYPCAAQAEASGAARPAPCRPPTRP